MPDPLSVLSQVNAACEVLYTSVDRAQRASADAFLSSVFGPTSPASTGCHLAAATPASLPALLSVLGTSFSPFAQTFCASAITACVDNHWPSLTPSDSFDLRTRLLEWLSSRGVTAPPSARGSVCTALARITKLGWRDDARHVTTVEQCLQFLAPSAGVSYHLLGCELLDQIVADMQRPHAHLPDRPTMQMLLFRDLALKPLFHRLVEMLGELHTAVTQALGEGGDAGTTTTTTPPDDREGERLAALLTTARHVLQLGLAVLTFNFTGVSALASAGDAGTYEGEPGGSGDDDSSALQLPSSWELWRRPASTVVFFTWARSACVLLDMAEGGGSFSPRHAALLAPLHNDVLELGGAALKCCAELAGALCTLWRERTLSLRAAFLVRAGLELVAFVRLHDRPERTRAGAGGGGARPPPPLDTWFHEVSRLCMRIKVGVSLEKLSASPDFFGFVALLADTTYNSLARGALPRRSKNSVSYLTQLFLELALPASQLPEYSVASQIVRSTLAPLVLGIIDANAPPLVAVGREGGGGGRADTSSVAVADESDDEETAGSEEEDAGDSAPLAPGGDGTGAGLDETEDETTEIAAALAQFHAAAAATHASERIESLSADLTDIMHHWSGDGTQQHPARTGPPPAIRLARVHRRLAWLARFSHTFITTVLSSDDTDVFRCGAHPVPPRYALPPERCAAIVPALAGVLAASRRTVAELASTPGDDATGGGGVGGSGVARAPPVRSQLSTPVAPPPGTGMDTGGPGEDASTQDALAATARKAASAAKLHPSQRANPLESLTMGGGGGIGMGLGGRIGGGAGARIAAYGRVGQLFKPAGWLPPALADSSDDSSDAFSTAQWGRPFTNGWGAVPLGRHDEGEERGLSSDEEGEPSSGRDEDNPAAWGLFTAAPAPSTALEASGGEDELDASPVHTRPRLLHCALASLVVGAMPTSVLTPAAPSPIPLATSLRPSPSHGFPLYQLARKTTNASADDDDAVLQAGMGERGAAAAPPETLCSPLALSVIKLMLMLHGMAARNGAVGLQPSSGSSTPASPAPPADSLLEIDDVGAALLQGLSLGTGGAGEFRRGVGAPSALPRASPMAALQCLLCWTPARVGLELALLNFAQALQGWYSRYRGSCHRWLAARSVLGALGRGVDDPTARATAAAIASILTPLQARGSSHGGPVAFTVVNGRLVPLDAGGGAESSPSQSTPSPPAGDCTLSPSEFATVEDAVLFFGLDAASHVLLGEGRGGSGGGPPGRGRVARLPTRLVIPAGQAG